MSLDNITIPVCAEADLDQTRENLERVEEALETYSDKEIVRTFKTTVKSFQRLLALYEQKSKEVKKLKRFLYSIKETKDETL